MGVVASETIKQYAEGGVKTASDLLAEDVKKFENSPAEIIGFLKQAKELYAAGSRAEADTLVDRAVNTMQAAFDEHLAECEVGGT